MKAIYKLLILVILTGTFSCKAQIPIVPLYLGDSNIANSYYKDLDHDLDKFVGTWRYENAGKILVVKFRKKEMHFSNITESYYVDLLVGEYQYIVNGVEISNTLSRLNNNYANEYEYTFCIERLTRACRTCPANKREVIGDFIEQDRPYIYNNKVMLRHIDEADADVLRFEFVSNGIIVLPDDLPANAPVINKLPFDVYMMVKQ